MLKGLFVGVNEYRDPSIRNLNGARWDAEAFGALFRDTLPSMKTSVVVDTAATVGTMRTELSAFLDSAEHDDTVVISFSGHGSPDHRLVLHDTELARLEQTSLSMAELAEAFRKSRARAIIFILDCCFSGAAPARVLDGALTPRAPGIPLEDLAGQGRILIAASSATEPAWEFPGRGHGLLTKALLEVLQEGTGDIDLLVAMNEVMARVRASALRLGQTQSPVLLGFVEGGLTMPALRAGAAYHTLFPELVGARVSSVIADLAAFGLPPVVLEHWSSQFVGGLNDLQLAAVNEHRVLDGHSLVVVAPTGAGKTFVGEMAAIRAISEGRRAVFLLPYKALVNEKFDDFGERYGRELGLRIIRCTSDYQDHKSQLLRGKYDLALLTYEMFLRMANFAPYLLNQLGLVVVDEAQFIADPHRGISLELLLTLLQLAKERGVAPQVIALSAVIGDSAGVEQWLGATKLATTVRPVPLIEGVLDRSGIYQFADTTGATKTEQFLPSFSVRQRKEEPSAQDVIVPLVRQLIHEKDETVIVFRNQRGPAEGCANYLGDELGLPAASQVLAALPTHDLTTSSQRLRDCLAKGTAFHTSNLTRDERVAVERGYRQGGFRVMAATTTLAAGINTPASTVILAEQEFLGEDGRPFTIAEYKNMAGRAGRPGFGKPGRAVILADNAYQREHLFRKYVLGTPESLTSSFDVDAIDTWILRLLTQVNRIRASDVVRLLANTFGGFLASRRDPTWQKTIEPRLTDLVQRMLRLALLAQDGEFVQLTLLGRACGESALPFDSCLRLVDLLRNFGSQGLSAEQLMIVLQALPESDGGFTPLMARVGKEKNRPHDLAARAGYEYATALQQFAADNDDYLKRCKRSLILMDWIDGVPLEQIEQHYSATPYGGRISHGDVRRFADATRFHLGSASSIASVMFVNKAPVEDDVTTLLTRLELGLPNAALSLLAIGFDFTRGECLALTAAGVGSPDQLWSTPQASLEQLLGAARLKQLERIRPTNTRTPLA